MRFWGVWPPSRFYEASIEDQAYALVAYEEEMKIVAYQQKLDKQEQERASANLNRD